MNFNFGENTFAGACFEQNSVEELEEALQGDADPYDCANWQITPEQWREQIQLALEALRGTVRVNGHIVDFDAAVHLMDDDLREQLHSTVPGEPDTDGRFCSNQAFVNAYAATHLAKYGSEFTVN